MTDSISNARKFAAERLSLLREVTLTDWIDEAEAACEAGKQWDDLPIDDLDEWLSTVSTVLPRALAALRAADEFLDIIEDMAHYGEKGKVPEPSMCEKAREIVAAYREVRS